MRPTRFWSVVLVFSALSCGDSSPTAPEVVQVAGTWTGSQTFTAGVGGECFAGLHDLFIGETGPFAITIAQTGDTLASSFAGCSYAGLAGPSSFTLNSTTCERPIQHDFPCYVASGGGTRDIAFIGEAMVGTVRRNTMSMTITQTHDVLVAGTNQSVGMMTLTFTVQASR